jgi:LysR family glycine cleavage system transcriptional activator
MRSPGPITCAALAAALCGRATSWWLDRSTIAIDAAVAGLGVVLESELPAEQELRNGRLIAPFDDHTFGAQTESYFVVRPPGSRNPTLVGKFEGWLLLSIKRGAGVASKEPE